MPSCCAIGCNNRTNPKGASAISLHLFPTDDRLRRAWISSLGRFNWTPSPNSRLCSVHFKPSEFRSSCSGKSFLKRTAMPSIFGSDARDAERDGRSGRKVGPSKPSWKEVHEEHQYARDPNKVDLAPSLVLVKIETDQDEVEEVETDDQEAFAQVSASNARLRLESTALNNKIRQLERRARVLENSLANSAASVKAIFNEDQLELLGKKELQGGRVSWTESTMKRALQIRLTCGNAGYELLMKQGHPLPSLRTLQRREREGEDEPGLLSKGYFCDVDKLRVSRIEGRKARARPADSSKGDGGSPPVREDHADSSAVSTKTSKERASKKPFGGAQKLKKKNSVLVSGKRNQRKSKQGAIIKKDRVSSKNKGPVRGTQKAKKGLTLAACLSKKAGAAVGVTRQLKVAKTKHPKRKGKIDGGPMGSSMISEQGYPKDGGSFGRKTSNWLDLDDEDMLLDLVSKMQD